MKPILLSDRFFKFATKRARVTSQPTKAAVKTTSESDGSSALSLGALQRRSIVSALNTSKKDTSAFMQLNVEGEMNKRRKKSFLCCRSSENLKTDEMTASRSSSIDLMALDNHIQDPEGTSNRDTSRNSSVYAGEFDNDVDSPNDFVIPLSLMKKKRRAKPISRKKKKRSFNTLRNFIRKSLKLPLDKSHQRWSRFSFDSRMSSELRF